MRDGWGVMGRLLAGVVLAAVVGWLAALGASGVGMAGAVPGAVRVLLALVLVLGGMLLAMLVAGSYQVHGVGIFLMALAMSLGLLVTGWVISGQRDLEGWGQIYIAAASPFVLVLATAAGLIVRASLERRGIDPLP